MRTLRGPAEYQFQNGMGLLSGAYISSGLCVLGLQGKPSLELIPRCCLLKGDRATVFP